MNMNFMNMPGIDVNNPMAGINSMNGLNNSLSSMNNLNNLGNMANLGNYSSVPPNLLSSTTPSIRDNMHNGQMNIPGMMVNQQQREREMGQSQTQTQQAVAPQAVEVPNMNPANLEMIKNMLR